MVSEAPESQFQVFLGMVWPTTDSINIVWWPGGHLNPYNTFGMHFGGELDETRVLMPFAAIW